MNLIPADITARVARNLRVARDDVGLTQDVVGAMFDPPMRRNEISTYEHGYRRPSDPKLIRFGEIYGRDFGWFFYDHNDGAQAA